MSEHLPQWLAWAREIQALAQNGLTYSGNSFDFQRYLRLEQIAAEIVANHSTLDPAGVWKSFQNQPGYATPKVDVRAAVIKDGKVLLVQERSDGKWCLPGGWADVGEAPSEAAQREAWEESGYEVQVERLIAVYDANRIPGADLELYHAYKLIVLCLLSGGEASPSDETLAVDFFDRDHLPPLSTFRTSEAILAEVFSQFTDPGRETAFD